MGCCSHTLSLIATVDANKVLAANDSPLSSMHGQVLKKCNSLWKKGSYPKSAEIIQDILGHALSKPGDTSWNSLYDSLTQILSIKGKSATLHKGLGLKNNFKDQEFTYIQEYLSCAKPVADALDILQSENNTYYGILLPTLLALRKNLQKLNEKNFVFCKQLCELFLGSVETRFINFFNVSSPQAENAVIAALSYPRFKTRWFVCVDAKNHEVFKNLFITAVAKEFIQQPIANTRNAHSKSKEDDFYNFESGSDNVFAHNHPRFKADLLITQYFTEESGDIELLERYPQIKSIFIKYNTPLPSSAPVERLFSFATITNTPKANRLSDSMFEKRVILKANLNYQN